MKYKINISNKQIIQEGKPKARRMRRRQAEKNPQLRSPPGTAAPRPVKRQEEEPDDKFQLAVKIAHFFCCSDGDWATWVRPAMKKLAGFDSSQGSVPPPRVKIDDKNWIHWLAEKSGYTADQITDAMKKLKE